MSLLSPTKHAVLCTVQACTRKSSTETTEDSLLALLSSVLSQCAQLLLLLSLLLRWCDVPSCQALCSSTAPPPAVALLLGRGLAELHCCSHGETMYFIPYWHDF